MKDEPFPTREESHLSSEEVYPSVSNTPETDPVEEFLKEIEKAQIDVSWATKEFCFEGKKFISHDFPKLLALVRNYREAILRYAEGPINDDWEKTQTGKGAPYHKVGRLARAAEERAKGIVGK